MHITYSLIYLTHNRDDAPQNQSDMFNSINAIKAFAAVRTKCQEKVVRY